MDVFVQEDQFEANTWRVEAIHVEGDGEIYQAVFYGPKAKERAEEYAAWKYPDGKPRVTHG